VVAPAVADLEESARSTLTAERETLDQRYRTAISGLDIRFEAMQAKLTECTFDDESQSLAHEPPACMRHERLIAEPSRLLGVAHDVFYVQYAGELVRLCVDDEERLLIRAPRAPQIGTVLRRRRSWDDVTAMQGFATKRSGEVVSLAARARAL
jgi:hypothetical protein